MMKFIFLLLLSSTFGSDTSGSILDQMDSSTSDAEYEEKLDNLEATETLGSSSSASLVDTSQSANDASNGLISEMLEMGVTNTELSSENVDLQSEYDLLQEQLADAVGKANTYRIDKEIKSNILNKEISSLDSYNHQLRKEEIEREDEVEDAGDDDDGLDELEVSGTMIFVIGLGFLFLLLHGARLVVGYNIDNFLSPALYTLFVDISILLVICTLTALASYFEIFDDDYLDYEIIIAGIAIFTFFWLVLGLWFIIAAQSFSTTWIRHEKACQDMRALTQIFQDAQIDMDGSAAKRMSSITRSFHYAIMRQLFICPTYLPPVTESYLRTDFDLSEYLSRSLASLLEEIFQLTWFGYSLIVIGILIWRVIVTGDDQAEFLALWAIPAVIILICLAILLKLRSIYYKLVPEPTDQIILNLPRDNFGRSPEMNEDIIPKPQYLRGHIYPKDREINFVNCCFVKVHPLKLTFSYIFAGSFPNRHELLFWFDRYGVPFIIGVLQAISIILTLWITVIILYYAPVLQDNWDSLGILLIGAAIIVYLFMACYLVPEAIRYLTLASKIEMKKDRKIIEEVILHEKIEKAKMVVRIYRQFKMIYRERVEEAKGQLDDNIRRFSHEIFFLIADPDTKTVSISQLEDLLSLCGVRLNEDELRLFAKECAPDNTNEIKLSGFQQAIAVLLASAVLKPQIVVRAVLTQYFKSDKGEVVKDITLEELKQFFTDFGWHFTDEDVEDFLWEARFLLEDVGSANIVEIAGFIRNNVESFPK